MDNDELGVALRTASQTLRQSPTGELSLPARERIWHALGPLLREGAVAVRSPGLARRTALAVRAAKKVLPVWERVWPANHGPQRMLELAIRYQAGGIELGPTMRERDNFWQQLDSLAGTMNVDGALAAGFAAVKALDISLFEARFDPNGSDFNEKAKDTDEDYMDWDASFFAAAAYVGESPFAPGPNVEKRREFWMWYLERAVPSVAAT